MGGLRESSTMGPRLASREWNRGLADPRSVVIVLVWMVWASGCNREPTYEDKPLAHWIVQLKDPDERQRIRAIDAIEALGQKTSDALPALKEALQDPEHSVRQWALIAYARLAGTEHDLSPVIEILKGPDQGLRRTAALVLRFGGKAAVPALIEALRDPEILVRENVLRSLEQIGTDAAEALPALRAAAQDPDEEFARKVKLAIEVVEGKSPPPK